MSQEPRNQEPAPAPNEPSDRNLPKAYDPSAIEQRWADYWVRERLFEVPTPATTAGAPSFRAAEGGDRNDAFTMLLPPPNVTGYLHMGHMFEHAESDILARWQRMCGAICVWVPGTDHAGIATQMLVERQLKVEGTDRKTLGREAFTERVWAWKRQYGSAITDQMRRLGASVDWSREYFTMDDRLSVAVKEAFVRLYEQGLIYRGAYIVNWDPVQQTAVSDLEVTHQERAGKLYHIRYPFADGTGSIVVATTRPETMLGDVAVAVNPNDERYQAFIGKLVTLPLSAAGGHGDREIPILADDWAQPEFGTGAVKVTPAHDPNDFAIGQRHALPTLTILDETAHVHLPGSPYHGLDRFDAREKIVADLEAAGLLVAIKDHSLAIALSQRTGAVIEPRLSMQWFVAVNKPPTNPATESGAPRSRSDRGNDATTNPGAPHLASEIWGPADPRSKSIADNAIAAVADGHIQFVPEMYRKTYMEWMTNIHDWCISRQLWWGHRIPAWHCGCGAITVARSTPTACSACHSTDIVQSTDVLDTWFSSGLLPFTVFGWPTEQGTETIRKTAESEGKYLRQVGGKGNYGHVRIRVSPNVPGGGLVFTNEAKPESVPQEYIEAIKEGIEEAMRGGIVAGFPLVDVKVSLTDGSHHEVDSNPMAFRIAASIAFKEAARKAEPVVLDPALEPSHLRSHGNLLTLEPASNLEPRTSNLTPDLAAFYPTTQLVTGFDILFFWVARMIMLGCHFMLDVPMPDGSARPLAEAVPFRNVYIHALIRDANREKMSKTKGNVVDPIEIITKYGTDAVRFTLASMASPGTDIAFSEARTEGYRAFANKIWNAARFLFMNLDRARDAGIEVDFTKLADALSPSENAPLESRWILTRLNQVSGQVDDVPSVSINRALSDYRFDEAANLVYQFFWGDLCDWYLEIVKLRLNFEPSNDLPFPITDDAEESVAETRAALRTLVAVFESALRLLSPFMPFLTEEIWHALYSGLPPAKSIALSQYPQGDHRLIGEQIQKNTLVDMSRLQNFIKQVRNLRKERGVPEKFEVPVKVYADPAVHETLSQNFDTIRRLARVSEMHALGVKPGGIGALSHLGFFEIELLYEAKIDVAAERERLTKDLAKLDKQITANESRLTDESFTAKAPPHIVEGLRKQTAELTTLRDKARAALTALG